MNTLDKEFEPGKEEDYKFPPPSLDPSHPDFDGSFDNWNDYFTETILCGKGRYLKLNVSRLGGFVTGRVDVLNSNPGEFIFQTGERIFYCIKYSEISGLMIRAYT